MVGRAWQSATGLPAKGGALLVKPLPTCCACCVHLKSLTAPISFGYVHGHVVGQIS